MASLVSHLSRRPEGGLVLLGMNAAELAANPVAEEHVLRDLNRDPELPFADAAFDAVTCCVSIDYLARPVEVLREVARVLRSAGRVSPSASARSSSFAETPGPATE
jgi:SAM-dependent methyltransferase